MEKLEQVEREMGIAQDHAVGKERVLRLNAMRDLQEKLDEEKRVNETRQSQSNGERSVQEELEQARQDRDEAMAARDEAEARCNIMTQQLAAIAESSKQLLDRCHNASPPGPDRSPESSPAPEPTPS